MDDLKGCLVKSVKGRDKGKHYVVAEIIDRYFVYVSDGDQKPLASPKRKNRKHIAEETGAPRMSMDFTDDSQGDDRIKNFLKCHEKEV